MKIPETITVAGIDYSIEEKEPDACELDYGRTTGSQCKGINLICIRETLSGQQKEQTVLHEITHAICDALNVSDRQIWIDERFVESFSQILYQVIKQL